VTTAREPAGELVVRFTRVSPTHHRFEHTLGARTESCLLETRSCLLHDLVHFALESEAGLTDSFYGKLARGSSYAELKQPGAAMAALGEIAMTEFVVGTLQGAWKSGFAPARYHAEACGYLAQLGASPPAWFTIDLLERVAVRLRALTGAWGGTKFGDALELRFRVRAP
jgi:hypothetical protein